MKGDLYLPHQSFACLLAGLLAFSPGTTVAGDFIQISIHFFKISFAISVTRF